MRRLLGQIVSLIDSDAGKRLALRSILIWPLGSRALQQSLDVVFLTPPLLSSEAPSPRWGASMCDLYHVDTSQASRLVGRFDCVIVENSQQQKVAQDSGYRALLVPTGADVCLDHAAQLQPFGPIIAHLHHTYSDQQDRPLAQAA